MYCRRLRPVQPSVAVDSDYSVIEIVLKLEKELNEVEKDKEALERGIAALSQAVQGLEARVKALEDK